MNVAAYLERIGYTGGTEPTLETLRGMHRAHAYHVPFENLDISRGVRIAVDEQVNYDKIVGRRRGGFCLELTGTFARALRALGFTVEVIGARVMSDGRLSEPMSHMTTIVHLDEPWIADVGFGGRIIEPLRLALEHPVLALELCGHPLDRALHAKRLVAAHAMEWFFLFHDARRGRGGPEIELRSEGNDFLRAGRCAKSALYACVFSELEHRPVGIGGKRSGRTS